MRTVWNALVEWQQQGLHHVARLLLGVGELREAVLSEVVALVCKLRTLITRPPNWKSAETSLVDFQAAREIEEHIGHQATAEVDRLVQMFKRSALASTSLFTQGSEHATSVTPESTWHRCRTRQMSRINARSRK